MKATVTQAKVDAYKVVEPMLSAIYSEIKALSNKKQAEELNPKKVDIINKVLDKALSILENEPTIEFLEKLNIDVLPTNSDAVLILSQFVTALHQFHTKYFHAPEFDWGLAADPGTWSVSDDE